MVAALVAVAKLGPVRSTGWTLDEVSALRLVVRTLAHDANNALGVILLLAGQLARRGDEESRPLAENLVLTSAHLSDILAQLRQVQDPESTSEALSVNRIIIGLEPMLRILAGIDRVFTTRLGDEVPSARVGSCDLQRALVNLVANARDATSAGDEIVISTHLALIQGEASVPRGRWVVVSVEDTGAGMDPATLARATEPHFTTRPRGQGTGLGLTSVSRVVRDSGGHLRIASSRGEGTIASMWFPASDVSDPEK